MKEGISMEKSIEKSEWIWLSKEDKPEIISRVNLVVTNGTMFNEIIADLKDLNKYIYAMYLRKEGRKTSNSIKYTEDGAIKYKAADDNYMYLQSLRVHAHDEYHYINPRAKLYQLLNSGDFSSYNLLDLFVEYGNNTEDRLEKLKRAKEIISQLESCSLPLETVKEIIKQMWPNFGYYATDVLNCTDIEMGQEYNVQELSDIVVTSEKFGVSVSDDVRIILSKAELAQNNTKVLSLARRVNRLVNPSK